MTALETPPVSTPPHAPAEKTVYLPAYAPTALTWPIHESPARFRVLCCGRRFGKSYFGLAELLRMLGEVYNAGCRMPATAHRPRGLVLAPTNKMVEENWQIAKTLFAPILHQEHIAKASLDLGRLGDVDFVSAESQGGAARGAGYDVAILDEAARIPAAAWEEDVRPALADRFGRAIMASTPFGRNWFYRLFRAGETASPDLASWRYPSILGWRSRAGTDGAALLRVEREWEQLRATSSERTFQQEWLAEFVEEGGSLWNLSAAKRGLLCPAMEGHSYVGGVDVARVDDWMVSAVLEVESRQLVGLLRSRQRSWDTQKASALSLLRQYPHIHVFVDSTGMGSPIAADFRSAGLSVEDVIFTERRKKDLVDNLALALDHGYLGVPDQPETQWLLDELRSYREWKTDSGRVKWGAPEGQHDDGVTALMLAAWGLRFDWATVAPQAPVREPGQPPAFTYTQLRQFSAQRRAWRAAYPDVPAPSSLQSLAWQSRPRWRSKVSLV